jgi:hypothetical protein
MIGFFLNFLLQLFGSGSSQFFFRDIVIVIHVCSCFMQGLNMFISPRFAQQEFGGPAVSNYENLKAEGLDFQSKFNELLEACKEKRQIGKPCQQKICYSNPVPWYEA